MLTALSIRVPSKRSGFAGFLDKFKRDRTDTRILRSRGVTLRHVTYTSYSGKIYLEKTDKAIEDGRTALLCTERLDFPEDSGYRRFLSRDFSARLCENFVMTLLDNPDFSGKISIGFFDPEGTHTEFLPKLVKNSANVTAVTDCPEKYDYIREELLDEMGVSAMVTKNFSELENQNVIIAPEPIRHDIHLKEDAIVLTTALPENNIGGQIFYRYSFRMPNGFSDIKPTELDEEYFCSALYSLAGQYELGSIVPLTCYNSVASHTAESLKAYLERFA